MTNPNQTAEIIKAVGDSLSLVREHLEESADRLCLDCGCADEDKALAWARESDRGAALVEIGLGHLVDREAMRWLGDDRHERRLDFGLCSYCRDSDEGRNDFDGFRMGA